MSTTDDIRTIDASIPPAGTAPRPVLRGRRGRQVAAAAVAVGVLGGGAFLAVTSLRSGTAVPTATTPIPLPDQLAGLSAQPAGDDPLHGDAWTAKARTTLGTAALAARLYAPSTGRRTLRIVAARSDLTGKLEQAWAVNAGVAVGQDHCTNNVRVAARTQPGVRPTVMLCWRTTSSFSAYSLIIDPAAKTPVSTTDGAAGLDAAWRAAGGPQ